MGVWGCVETTSFALVVGSDSVFTISTFFQRDGFMGRYPSPLVSTSRRGVVSGVDAIAAVVTAAAAAAATAALFPFALVRQVVVLLFGDNDASIESTMIARIPDSVRFVEDLFQTMFFPKTK